MIGWLGNLSLGDILILIAGRRTPTGERIGEAEAITLASELALALSGEDRQTVLVTFSTSQLDLDAATDIVTGEMAAAHWDILSEQMGWIEIERGDHT